MNINEYIREYKSVRELDSHHELPPVKIQKVPHVVCKDGFKMSVQAGESLYSSPRVVADEYVEVEVGYPSEQEVLLEKYAEGASFDEEIEYTNTVYPYMPVEVVDEVIEKHGGIDESAIDEEAVA